MTAILISEVGPRDGLQSIARTMPLDARRAWIAAEPAPTRPHFEVGLSTAFGCTIEGHVPEETVARLAEAAIAAGAAEALPGEPLYGFTPDAGLPLGIAERAA